MYATSASFLAKVTCASDFCKKISDVSQALFISTGSPVSQSVSSSYIKFKQVAFFFTIFPFPSDLNGLEFNASSPCHFVTKCKQKLKSITVSDNTLLLSLTVIDFNFCLHFVTKCDVTKQ